MRVALLGVRVMELASIDAEIAVRLPAWSVSAPNVNERKWPRTVVIAMCFTDSSIRL